MFSYTQRRLPIIAHFCRRVHAPTATPVDYKVNDVVSFYFINK